MATVSHKLPAVLGDPALAAAPIPEAIHDTSGNVDRETAALLSAMPPLQQAEYLAGAATAQQAAADADAAPGQGTASGAPGSTGSTNSTAGGSSGSGAAGDGSDASAAAAAAELMSVLEVLKSTIADGSMEKAVGYATLDLSATVL
jgi:hypothetical protein